MKQPEFYHWIDHELAAKQQHAEIAKITGVGNGRMLELFSGNGCYLKYFQDQGWECLGLETDDALAESAMLDTGVPTLNGELHEIVLPVNSYDIVRIRGALSTIQNPKMILDTAFQAVAPTSYVIAEVWNRSGFPMMVSSDSVMNRFDRDSISQLFKDSGFEVGGIIAPAVGDPIWAPLKQEHRLPALWRRTFDTLQGFFDRGSLLVVFAQRPPHTTS